MKRCAVTGATGFIGSGLIRRLKAANATIRAIVRDGARRDEAWDEMREVDLGTSDLDPEVFEGIDTVFHLAAHTHALSEPPGDERGYVTVNVGGTRDLVAAAKAAGVERFVFVSSVKAMGEGGPQRLDETAEPMPASAYGRTKLAAERIVLGEMGDALPRGVCLRLPMVYGPGNKGNIFRMIAAIDLGVFPPIPEFGNRRSLVHVRNVVEALILCATRDEAGGRTYIVTDGRSFSTREMYERIAGALGRRVPQWTIPAVLLSGLARAGDAAVRILGRRLPFDSQALEKLAGSADYGSERIARELGYRPVVSFEEALPELVAWYRAVGGSRLAGSRRSQ